MHSFCISAIFLRLRTWAFPKEAFDQNTVGYCSIGFLAVDDLMNISISALEKEFAPFEGRIWLNAASEGPLPLVAARALVDAVEWKKLRPVQDRPILLPSENGLELPLLWERAGKRAKLPQRQQIRRALSKIPEGKLRIATPGSIGKSGGGFDTLRYSTNNHKN